MSKLLVVVGSCSLTMAMFVLVPFSRPVQAEWYVAGQVGPNLPADFSSVRLSGGGTTVAVSDLDLQTSVAYGGKVGYYFASVKWLGIETEVFNATPHIKQQDWVISGNFGTSPPITLPGIYNRMLTWAR
ncbi:MAG: hypothetical protein P0120_00055 [Nitrospira sp.]|nr:hypothetical protein [Nitrospira sp.]